MLQPAKESSPALPERPALTHPDNPSDAGAGEVARTCEANPKGQPLRPARRSANSCDFSDSSDFSGSGDSSESFHYDFGRRVDLLAAESTVGGSPLRHRHGGGGETDGAAPTESRVERQHLRHSPR